MFCKGRMLPVSKTLPLFFLLLATVSIGVAGSAPMARKPRKNPKLSTQLDELARAVPQRTAPLAPGERLAAPKGFAVQKLPKPIRDAIRAGMMRISSNAEVQVYIEVAKINASNLAQLRSLGLTVQILGEPKPNKAKGEVLTAVPTVQALLPVTMINQVAALPFVRYVRLPDYGFTNTGSVDSQGDSLLKADLARQQFGVDGTGIKVGVISNGIGGIFDPSTCSLSTEVPNPIQTGDLPSATPTCIGGVLTALSGGITAQSFPSSSPNLMPPSSEAASGYASEGTAMLEIVHDLAPGAQLYFANFDTSMAFEGAVNWLAPQVDVGVDDVGFFVPPFDSSSGTVASNTASALNTDTNPIRGYFTAVGNLAFNHYEQGYGSLLTDTLSCPNGVSESGGLQYILADGVTTFANPISAGQGVTASNYNPFYLPAGGTVNLVLTWDDPYSGSSNDYDLFLYLYTGSGQVPVACSINPQTGTQPPFETITYSNTSAGEQYLFIYILNVNNAAAPRNLDMFVLPAGSNAENLGFYTPSGSVADEADAGGSPVSVVSVGATDAQTDTNGDGPGTVLEPYSSQGPTEATPQAAARMKPDVTATDGVSVTGAGGFGSGNTTNSVPCSLNNSSPPGCYFFGTSAAAPHAAAVAALVLQAAPCLRSGSTVNTPATARTNLRNFLTGTAVPLSGVSGAAPNDIEGYGLLDALAAVSAAMPTANAGTAQTVNATGTSGATVTLSGSGTDPDSCPFTMTWGGSCGNATGANPSVNCPIGNDTETLTVSNGGATAGLPTSNVQIAVSDFTVTSTQTSANVSPGQSGAYTVNVGEKYGAFSNSVSLACSGLPSEATCIFSPASVTPGSGTATSTLTISTTASSSVLPIFGPGGPNTRLLVLWLGLLLALTALAVFARKSKRKFGFAIASCALLICLVAPVVSCGGGGSSTPSNPGTPVGMYSVTVTGTSNQLQHSTTVGLTVQ